MRSSLAATLSALWFVLAPGAVAGLVPWLLTGWRAESAWWPIRIVGAALILVAVPVLLHSFLRFVRDGHGTPIPAAPPRRLVVTGLYRYVRNPMYVAVNAAIVGQAMLLGRLDLLWYAVAVIAVNLGFVHLYEERELRRRFGQDYDRYRQAVPAWWPRLRPWRPTEPQAGDRPAHSS